MADPEKGDTQSMAPNLEDEIYVSNFYIYLFDKSINQYRKIIKLDINNDADDVYLRDGSLGYDTTHLSFHSSGEVHIRHYDDNLIKNKKKDIIFINSNLYKSERFYQFMYYKIGDIKKYPVVLSDEMCGPKLIMNNTEKQRGCLMIKFLIGKLPLRSSLVHRQHTLDVEGKILPLILHFKNKVILLSAIFIDGEDEEGQTVEGYKDDIHVILFNTDKEILDKEMCKKKFDIGKIKKVGSGDIQVDWKKEDVAGEEIFSIYYRTNHVGTKEK